MAMTFPREAIQMFLCDRSWQWISRPGHVESRTSSGMASARSGALGDQVGMSQATLKASARGGAFGMA